MNTTPTERERLLQYSRPLGNAIKERITIVTPQTFIKWVRDAERAESNPAKQGRPRVLEPIHDLIVRMARESEWGYTCIQCDIFKLDRTVGRSPVRRVLQDENIQATPNRPDETWRELLKRHRELF